jgi:hypothetical protein
MTYGHFADSHSDAVLNKSQQQEQQLPPQGYRWQPPRAKRHRLRTLEDFTDDEIHSLKTCGDLFFDDWIKAAAE